MHIHVLRLKPGDDLRAALASFVERQGVGAGFVLSAVGSLSRAALRFAGQETGTHLQGDLEILTLAGTLSPDGCHLHASVSDARGHVAGGHVLPGCAVRTTAEIVIGLAPDLAFSRAHDPDTGYRELCVAPINSTKADSP